MATNKLILEVEALDPTFGYSVKIHSVVAGAHTVLNEHYATEAASKARLATAWDFWAAQVDSE
jgi:hypothetical protein